MLRQIPSDDNLDRRDLFTKSRQAWLKTAAVSDVDRFCLDQLGEEWADLMKRRQAVEQALREFAKAGSETEQLDRKILQMIPGVGPVTSEVILAELADARRFSSLKKVVAYAGLAPGQRESAGKRRSPHIEKTGSPLLRWVLVQAAWQLAKRSPKWRTIYENLQHRITSVSENHPPEPHESGPGERTHRPKPTAGKISTNLVNLYFCIQPQITPACSLPLSPQHALAG